MNNFPFRALKRKQVLPLDHKQNSTTQGTIMFCCVIPSVYTAPLWAVNILSAIKNECNRIAFWRQRCQKVLIEEEMLKDNSNYRLETPLLLGDSGTTACFHHTWKSPVVFLLQGRALMGSVETQDDLENRYCRNNFSIWKNTVTMHYKY